MESIGLAIVIVGFCGVLLPERQRRTVLWSAAVGTVIGGIAYPLMICVFMGFAAALRYSGSAWWDIGKLTFITYAKSATVDLVPRGAGLGFLTSFAFTFWRSRRTKRPLNASVFEM